MTNWLNHRSTKEPTPEASATDSTLRLRCGLSAGSHARLNELRLHGYM
jgi:hypothetical protein